MISKKSKLSIYIIVLLIGLIILFYFIKNTLTQSITGKNTEDIQSYIQIFNDKIN